VGDSFVFFVSRREERVRVVVQKVVKTNALTRHHVIVSRVPHLALLAKKHVASVAAVLY
jgi:hypothetical protein